MTAAILDAETPGRERPEAASGTRAALTRDGFAALRRSPLLAGLGDELLGTLTARARWAVYEAGQVILDFGDRTNEVFFITDGLVRVVLRSAQGHEAILNELGTGDLFGELAAIDGQPRSANVTALRRTALCAVPAGAFIALALGTPELGLRVMRLLTARVRAKDACLLERATLSARQRLIVELLRLSRDRGGGERVLSPPPPQHILAARIGTRRETVSRELASMARAGLLTATRRGIVLHRSEDLIAEVADSAAAAVGPSPTARCT